jgi:nucleolar protein 58
VFNETIAELFRGLRTHINELVEGVDQSIQKSMSVGLAHSLARHKLKFSTDKVDTMIIQAIGKRICIFYKFCFEVYFIFFPFEVHRTLLDSFELICQKKTTTPQSGLLDDIDKELNTYAMRLREWYGWHFPELTKIIPEQLMYAKLIKKMGRRSQAQSLDFGEILPEEIETELKALSIISMGTEVRCVCVCVFTHEWSARKVVSNVFISFAD